MSVLERIMQAYASKHALSPHQAALVRLELSSFITELAGHASAKDVSDRTYSDGGDSGQRSICGK